MNIRLFVVLFIVAVITTEAKPGKNKGSGQNQKSGPQDVEDNTPIVAPEITDRISSLTVESIADLCEGLENGTIVNDDASYTAVFDSLDTICEDLLALLEAQSLAPNTARVKRGLGRGLDRGLDRGHGGESGGDSSENDESSESQEEEEETGAVASLFFVCDGVELVLGLLSGDLADQIPTDLLDIFNELAVVCAAADLIQTPD